MRYSLVSLTTLAAGAFAAVNDVNFIWQHHSQTGASSLSIFGASKEKVLAHACGSVLEDEKIDFSLVTDDGTGNFTVGGDEYLVHFNPTFSGGPSCTTVYNDRMTVVECAHIPLELADVNTRTISRRALDECFDGEDVQAEFQGLRSRGTASSFVSPFTKSKARNRRQIIYFPPSWNRGTVLHGNGAPFPCFLHRQLTTTNDCTDGACSVTFTEGTTYTVGFTATVSPFSWISGGFSVSKAYSTSQGHNCNGVAGQKICVWHKMAHTGYTVINRETLITGKRERLVGDPFEIRSPNKNNAGGNYYCVRGPCRNINDQYWQNPEARASLSQY